MKPSNRQIELIDPLTERELEILQLLAKGWSDRKIANDLVLALETVKWYNKRVYSKLSAKNRTEAVARARELGLFAVDSTPNQPDTVHHNLPAMTTPFVGRDLELRDLGELLSNQDTRLVTIQGVGGMGKTRLALEVAKHQLPHFQNGVYFIPLIQLRAVDDIISTIAVNLNLEISTATDALTQLIGYFRERNILLVLDNFEHLLDGAHIITALLEAAPHLQVLITSRERLNLRAETVYVLGGMTLPKGTTSGETRNAAAVQLFIQRLETIAANQAVSDDQLQYIHRICRQVWGMPLGIELAASLVSILSLQEIAANIEQNYDILSTEMRDMPPRLRSIRAVFDYSWSRLSEAEQGVFIRLAVFRDGFTLEAAQTVARADLPTLIRLTNKSLLQRNNDRGRYVIHELLRQYAEERLQQPGSASETYQVHSTYYATLMEQYQQDIKSRDQFVTLNLIDADFENIRAAWQWAIQQGDYDAIDQSLEALYWFCNMRARVPDGKRLFQQAREQLGLSFALDAHPVQRRLLLHFDASGEIYRQQIEQMLVSIREQDNPCETAFFLWMLGVNRYVSGDFAYAIDILQEAVDRFDALHDDFYKIEALHSIGVCARSMGKIQEAKQVEQQLRNLSRKTGNKFALGRALGSQGLLAVYESDEQRAEDYLRQAIAIRRDLGDFAGVAVSLVSLSINALFKGELSKAKSLADEALELATEFNSLFPRAIALSILGWLTSIDEVYDEGRKLSQQSLLLAPNPVVSFSAKLGLAMAECGLKNYSTAAIHVNDILKLNTPWYTTRGLMCCMPVLAIIYAAQNHPEAAVELLALALTHPESPSPWIVRWQLIAQLQSDLETQLGPQTYEMLWESGASLELEFVISRWFDNQQR
jgi:predicted ATPase/DNA-binding CsgD family transcriptional regulator